MHRQSKDNVLSHTLYYKDNETLFPINFPWLYVIKPKFFFEILKERKV